tara:strand:+ start:218 stop:973 length:756 start_codon:yes stop_codon:yes gene_type:complete
MTINLKGWLSLFIFLSRRTLVNKKIFIVVAFALLLSSLVVYFTVAEETTPGTEDVADLLDIFVMTFFLLFIPMIYGSSILRSDLEDNSIITILTSPLDRRLIFFGYLISLYFGVIVVMLILTSVGPLTLFALVGIPTGAIDLYIKVCVLVIIGSIVYSSLYLTVSLITKKVIYFGLFYAFIWEGFVSFIPGGIGDFTIRHYIRSIRSSWIEHGEFGIYEGAEVQYSFLVLTAISIALIALGSFLLYRKEME